MISYNQEAGQAYSGKKSSNTLLVPYTPLNTIPVGDTIVLEISIKSNVAISSVMDTAGNIFTFRGGVNQGSSLRTEFWTAPVTVAITYGSANIIITAGASVSMVAIAEDYSGVVELGSIITATGTGAQPSITLATQDNNNWIVVAFGWEGPSTTVTEAVCSNPPTCTILLSPAGFFRGSDMTTNSGTEVGIACNDNTVAIPGNVINTLQLTASAPWSAVALELRTI